MNARKFVAPSAGEALRKAKELLGPDAYILSRRATSNGMEIVAVAANDLEMAVDPGGWKTESRSDDYTVSISEQATNRNRARGGVPPLAPRPMPHLERPAPQAVREAEIVSAEVMEEVRYLRRMFEQHLAGIAYGEAARCEPIKTEILRQMLDTGFSPRLAHDLLTGLPRELDAAKALDWAKTAADRSLLTIGKENDIIDRGGIYALVGPTGVGKTTTTAKLAARCVERYGAKEVALITTDDYRIGAYEQLKKYGHILHVPVYLVRDAEDLQQTLTNLAHKHMVLIDTIGMSQRDRMVEEQIAMLGHNGVRRLVLLAATGSGDTLDDVVNVYKGPDVVGCVLSKIDEAASLAGSLDVIIRHRLPLHYVSNGQRVPEDLHLPNRSYLLHRAFKDLPKSSPHRLGEIEPRLLMASANAAASGGRYG
ncbi:MAG: flagellar biosynthesis protein FlhF [Candidatus Accumulibacter sp.]|nr:flagellar biosynthesis protein FlhF [Accumulibacter sp.]